MAAVEGIPGGNPPKEWFCDFTVTESPEFFIMALRYDDPERRNEIYSNLVGWFAVSKTTTAVMEWDINEDKAIPISPLYYGIAR
jgi:hypothetical protein